jgi:hypothetical protein
MTPKKKTEEQPAEQKPEIKATEASAEEQPRKAGGLCGHVNMHSFGPDGTLDQPVCDLPKEHQGDHHGKHQQKVERERFYERETGKLLKIEYDIEEKEIWWNNAAGTPAKDITPGPLPSRNKKSEILQAVEQLLK